mgnify:CR=1 FL=1
MNPSLIKRIKRSRKFNDCLAAAETINCVELDGNRKIDFSEFVASRYLFLTGEEWDKEKRALTLFCMEYSEEGKQKLDAELERIVEAL